MPQDGARIIGEDSEVPPVPEEEEEEDITTGLEGPSRRRSILELHRLLTLKRVPTSLWGIRCRAYWCPPSHNAPPRGSPSAPRSSSTLAARTQKHS